MWDKKKENYTPTDIIEGFSVRRKKLGTIHNRSKAALFFNCLSIVLRLPIEEQSKNNRRTTEEQSDRKEGILGFKIICMSAVCFLSHKNCLP